MIVCAAVMAALAVGGGAAVPAITGADASVAVNRETGEVAVLRGRTLTVVRDGATLDPVELARENGRLLDFRGATVLLEFPEGSGQGAMRAAISPQGRERLAWPNPGLGGHFPHLETVLTLDGRGLYADLILNQRVRGELGGLEGIADGAGVVATFRFRGGLIQARASESFGSAVALTTDDFLVSRRDGGLLRFRSPDGVVWSLDPPPQKGWRVVDVGPSQGLVLVESGGEWLGLALDSGKELWRLDEATRVRAVQALGVAAGLNTRGAEGLVRDGRLLPDGRVLFHGGATADWVGVFDPSILGFLPAELLSGLVGPEWRELRQFWVDRRLRLDSLQVWASPAGVGLLLRGPDGWYRVQLPGNEQ